MVVGIGDLFKKVVFLKYHLQILISCYTGSFESLTPFSTHLMLDRQFLVCHPFSTRLLLDRQFWICDPLASCLVRQAVLMWNCRSVTSEDLRLPELAYVREFIN